MSEAAAPAAPAPAPTNGATAPQKSAATVVPVLKDATGPQTPVRDPVTGKFAPVTPKVEEKPAPKPRIKIKDIDLDEESAYAELMRGRQASKLLTEAQKKAAQAEQIERARNEEREALKKGPGALKKYLKDAGLDDNQIRQYLTDLTYSEVIEPESLSEDQKARRAAEAELEKYRAKEAEEKTKAEKAQQEAEAKQAEAQLETEIQEAIEAGSIPATKSAVRRIAGVVARYETKGINIPVAKAAEIAKQEIGKETGEFASSASVDQLIGLWGKGPVLALAKKFSEWAVSKRAEILKPPANPKPPPAVEVPKKKLTPQEFDQFIKGVK